MVRGVLGEKGGSMRITIQFEDGETKVIEADAIAIGIASGKPVQGGTLYEEAQAMTEGPPGGIVVAYATLSRHIMTDPAYIPVIKEIAAKGLGVKGVKEQRKWEETKKQGGQTGGNGQ
jgi:hypothetical protein